MRVVLATCVLALTACAAEADVETQATLESSAQTQPENAKSNGIHSVDELLADVRKQVEAERDERGLGGISSPSATRRVAEYRKLLQEKDNLDFFLRGDPRETLTDTQLEDLERKLQILIAEADALLARSIANKDTSLYCHGVVKQGGLVVCQTKPNARVEVGRSENDTYTQTADKDGVLLVGFDRDEPAAFVRVGDERVDFDIQKREYDISRINGLPSNMVNEYSAEELARIRKASALKKVGFASMVEEVGFKNGFIYPVADYIKTTNFGAQRILNGEPKSPHFGVDLAAPKGTPIVAPADGIVSLASEDMYFEGSLIMIDHGQGLISYYLHNETVDVEDGQKVVQGQQIGTVGSRGRSTGPHLCWRLKWRGRNLDPELLTEWPTHG